MTRGGRAALTGVGAGLAVAALVVAAYGHGAGPAAGSAGGGAAGGAGGAPAGGGAGAGVGAPASGDTGGSGGGVLTVPGAQHGVPAQRLARIMCTGWGLLLNDCQERTYDAMWRCKTPSLQPGQLFEDGGFTYRIEAHEAAAFKACMRRAGYDLR